MQGIAIYILLVSAFVHYFVKEDKIEPKFSSFLEVWKVMKGFWYNEYLRYYLFFTLFMNIATGMHDPVNSGGQIILLRKGF